MDNFPHRAVSYLPCDGEGLFIGRVLQQVVSRKPFDEVPLHSSREGDEVLQFSPAAEALPIAGEATAQDLVPL
jgi:hypothetical protein